MASVTTDRRRGINSGAAIKTPCIAGSTADLTLSGEQTIDGISLVTDDRVLVKDQSTATENGIYAVNTSTWSREPDFDGNFDVVEGTIVPVSRGTANATTYWRITNTGDITIGTTSLTFAVTSVLDSAILRDGSVKMIADFSPNVDATYDLGTALLQWVDLHLSGNGLIGGTLGVTGVTTHGDDVVSDTDSTDDLGTTGVRWANAFIDLVTTDAIQFAATQVPSADANALDDYEENEFQVTLAPSSSGTITIDTSIDTLAYTKVGRVCHVQGLIQVSGVSSPIGVLVTLSGLPFTSATLTEFSDSIAFPIRITALGALADGFHVGTITSGNTTMSIIANDASSIADDFQASTTLEFNFSYITA